MPPIKDLTGLRFGLLTVISMAPKRESIGLRSMWLCKCDCGQEKTIRSRNLIQKLTTSCGCVREKWEGLSKAVISCRRKWDRLGVPECQCPGPRKKGHRLCSKHKSLWGNYKMTPSEYDQKVASQNGLCAICNIKLALEKPKSVAVDHDHQTKQIRSLLCSKCNMAIGLFMENPEALERAAAYLRFYKELHKGKK